MASSNTPKSLSSSCDDNEQTKLNQLEEDAKLAALLASQDLSRDEIECDSDAALAMYLQKQFDHEYNNQIKKQEQRINGQSKVGISLDRFKRSASLDNNLAKGIDSRRDGNSPFCDADDDDYFQDDQRSNANADTREAWDVFEDAELKRRSRMMGRSGFVLDHDGNMITKHDIPTSSRKNMCRLMELRTDIQTGDAGGTKDDFKITNYVYNKLKVHSKKSSRRASQRLFDKRERENVSDKTSDDQSAEEKSSENCSAELPEKQTTEATPSPKCPISNHELIDTLKLEDESQKKEIELGKLLDESGTSSSYPSTSSPSDVSIGSEEVEFSPSSPRIQFSQLFYELLLFGELTDYRSMRPSARPKSRLLDISKFDDESRKRMEQLKIKLNKQLDDLEQVEETSSTYREEEQVENDKQDDDDDREDHDEEEIERHSPGNEFDDLLNEAKKEIISPARDKNEDPEAKRARKRAVREAQRLKRAMKVPKHIKKRRERSAK